jgi:hypothetical protein
LRAYSPIKWAFAATGRRPTQPNVHFTPL